MWLLWRCCHKIQEMLKVDMFLNVGSIQRVTLVWLVQMMRVMTMDQSGLKQPRRQQGSQGPPKAAQCQPRYDLLRSILCLPSMPFSFSRTLCVPNMSGFCISAPCHDSGIHSNSCRQTVNSVPAHATVAAFCHPHANDVCCRTNMAEGCMCMTGAKEETKAAGWARGVC